MHSPGFWPRPGKDRGWIGWQAPLTTFDIADASLGTGGFWWDHTDTANLFQSSAGTGAVTNSDPVGYGAASDGDNFVQATGGERPTFATGQGPVYDAFDDTLVRTPTGGAGPAACSVFIRATYDGGDVCLAYGVDGVRYLFLAQAYGLGQPNGASGTATCVVDGSIACTTRDDLYEAVNGGAFHTLEAQSADLSNWPVFGIGSWGTGGYWDGAVARGVVATSAALSADPSLRGNILNWLAKVS